VSRLQGRGAHRSSKRSGLRPKAIQLAKAQLIKSPEVFPSVTPSTWGNRAGGAQAPTGALRPVGVISLAAGIGGLHPHQHGAKPTLARVAWQGRMHRTFPNRGLDHQGRPLAALFGSPPEFYGSRLLGLIEKLPGGPPLWAVTLYSQIRACDRSRQAGLRPSGYDRCRTACGVAMLTCCGYPFSRSRVGELHPLHCG
jgi:hypothetical protein